MNEDFDDKKAKTFQILREYPPYKDRDFAFPVISLITNEEGFIFKDLESNTFIIVPLEHEDGEFIPIKNIKMRNPIFKGAIEEVIKNGWVTL